MTWRDRSPHPAVSHGDAEGAASRLHRGLSSRLRGCCLVALFLATPALAQRDPGCLERELGAYSVLPMLEAVGGGRGAAPYCLVNLRAPATAVRSGADLGAEPGWDVPVVRQGFTLAPGKLGNYHWLQAREETPEGIVTASTAHYFANPGPAPSALLRQPKAELEIVPQPLPREHWRYRAGESWTFLVRFHGQPLPGAGVRLETSGGHQTVYQADARGQVQVNFPDDVRTATAPGGHHGRQPENRFVLAVGHTDAQGRYYLTAFNHRYAQAADQGKDYAAGLGFLLLGGLLASPLAFARGKETKHG